MLAGCPFPVRGGGSGVPRPRVLVFLAVRVLFALCFFSCSFLFCAGRGVFFRVFPVIFLRAFMFLYSRGVRCARRVFCVSMV